MEHLDAAQRPRIVIPRFGGKRGHPIVLAREGFEGILSLDRDATLKTYTSMQRSQTLDLDVDDSAVVRDIDTPADLAAENRLDPA